ncbi:MAG TPA: glycosyltransferase [Solirubrobacteraceae bacterium]
MEVTLHWNGDWPEYLAPMLTALESLPEAEHAPDGAVAFCPDATAIAPPAQPAGALVAAVPFAEDLFDPNRRDALGAVLAQWAQRGAVFTTPTPTVAAALRAGLNLPADRVRSAPLPLPPERIPSLTRHVGEDILALGPVNYGALLPALGLLRIAGLDRRLLIADPDAGPVVAPGGLATAYGLLAGREVQVVSDWRAAVASAGAILISDSPSTDGVTLREALATGVPVVASNASLVRDHLSGIGAGAYVHQGQHDLQGFVGSVAAALRRDRGHGLEAAAREAVLAETWENAARELLETFTAALAPAPAAAPSATAHALNAPETAPRVQVVRDPLELCVVNPKASGGGGERFMRALVGAIAAHRSAPRVKLVCHVDPGAAFDPGTERLQRAGVQVRTVSGSELESALAAELGGSDVVYYSWPHSADPPAIDKPLVCTFHDLNWKHFDVINPAGKAEMERQAPLWIERCSAIVHSSRFIRDELQRYYDAPKSLTRVILTAAEAPATPTTAAERDRVRRRFALPERFLLSPNGRHLHKNYPVLDAALRVLRREGRPVPVVASGLATDLYNGPDLIGLGYVSSRELDALYDECAGVVQTTLYEAGSFPMVEAMSAGKPVAISSIPPIIEQVESWGVVAELFDPLDPEDVAGAIWRLWEGSEATEPHTIAANAKAVQTRTWDDVAGDYLKLFAELRR